ncbi:hypothetical protein BsIDN1_20420 [Bacillus safensis]|uniref:HAMP domain-containing protein n=1 Tax=Bacillus safensis TaxID=561879 RepID=A0A5S9M8E2_BACIA|nr:hypothetical protein BsIDN1_20420 [Bacillus safensis]
MERMDIQRKDEIGGLNESFNQMTDQLISLIKEISNVSSRVETFSIHLNDEKKKMMESANQVYLFRQTKWPMGHKRFQKISSTASA